MNLTNRNRYRMIAIISVIFLFLLLNYGPINGDDSKEVDDYVFPYDNPSNDLKATDLIWRVPLRSPHLKRGYVLWGTDTHMGPRREFSSIFPKMGMTYIDRGLQIGSLPGMTEEARLEMIYSPFNVDRWKGFQREFFEKNKDNPELKRVDAFVCSFDPHYCMLFIPWNKPIIAVHAFRLEGHHPTSKHHASAWLTMLKQMDRHPDVVLGSTNLYDAIYTNHFTGSRRVVNLDSLGDYIRETYHPKEKSILIGPYRVSGAGSQLGNEMKAASVTYGSKYSFKFISEVYGHYEYDQLCDHSAIALFPYSIHSYGMLELRKMNIPLIFPSVSLLAKWEAEHHILPERNSDLSRTSSGHLTPSHRSLSGDFNPYNDFSIPDIEYWLQYSDFYQWPTITYDNFTHLFQILDKIDLDAVSKRMIDYNAKLEKDIIRKWENVFHTVFGDIPPGERPVPSSYEEGMRIWEEKTKIRTWTSKKKPEASDPKSDRWVVISTTQYPMGPIKSLALQSQWKVLVVADRKTPKNWALDNVIFLDVNEQQKLGYRITSMLPWNHISRKNIGYLYAIQHGAKIIYDIDDSNLIKGDIFMLNENSAVQEVQSSHYLVNPYPYFGQSEMWPRGFPLEEINNKETKTMGTKQYKRKLSIQQGLIDRFPDVDAISALTSRRHSVRFAPKEPISLAPGTYSPFNSLNTAYHYSAFWGLLLPSTTTDRVADIWRGYWVQRLLWEIGGQLCFLNATTIGDSDDSKSRIHLDDELELSQDAGRLVNYLTRWVPDMTSSLFEIVLELHRDMAAGGFWERKDAKITEAWLLDLIDVGYQIPPLKKIVSA